MKSIDYVLYSIDPVILSIVAGELSVLVVKRKAEPFKGQWGLPGGRVDQKACLDLDGALQKKLAEKTGIKNVFFEQVQTYGSSEMDPRGWSVTTSYLALLDSEDPALVVTKSDDKQKWVPVSTIGKSESLAFWHNQIVLDAVARLRSKSLYTDLPVNLMPEIFTYQMLRNAYEVVLGISLSRQAFTRRMEDAGIFEDTGDRERGSNRPAPLYRKKERGGAFVFPRQLKGE